MISLLGHAFLTAAALCTLNALRFGLVNRLARPGSLWPEIEDRPLNWFGGGMVLAGYGAMLLGNAI